MWRSVDLPAPDGPMIDTNSPERIARSIARRIQVVVAPLATVFSMPFVVISESAKRHSYRNATSGATRIARRAGTYDAMSATAVSTAATATNVHGSVARTSNSSEDIRCVIDSER